MNLLQLENFESSLTKISNDPSLSNKDSSNQLLKDLQQMFSDGKKLLLVMLQLHRLNASIKNVPIHAQESQRGQDSDRKQLEKLKNSLKEEKKCLELQKKQVHAHSDDYFDGHTAHFQLADPVGVDDGRSGGDLCDGRRWTRVESRIADMHIRLVRYLHAHKHCRIVHNPDESTRADLTPNPVSPVHVGPQFSRPPSQPQSRSHSRNRYTRPSNNKPSNANTLRVCRSSHGTPLRSQRPRSVNLSPQRASSPVISQANAKSKRAGSVSPSAAHRYHAPVRARIKKLSLARQTDGGGGGCQQDERVSLSDF
jgi:hypothetical protein